MNNQEAFNTIARHLFAQGKRALITEDELGNTQVYAGCLYRGPNGTKCAVGCIIPDDEYRSEFEGSSVSIVKENVPSIRDLNSQLLCDLQEAHDLSMNWMCTHVMKAILSLIAINHELDDSVLKDLKFADR